MQDLPLGGYLIEELGELLLQDTILADKHNNQGKEQLKLGHVTVHAGIHVGQV